MLSSAVNCENQAFGGEIGHRSLASVVKLKVFAAWGFLPPCHVSLPRMISCQLRPSMLLKYILSSKTFENDRSEGRAFQAQGREGAKVLTICNSFSVLSSPC